MEIIKIKYYYQHKETGYTTSRVYTLDEIENRMVSEGAKSLGKRWFCLKRCLYTGLKDINGKEIYAGDIVKTTHNEHYWVYVIKPSEICPNGQLYAIEQFNNLSTDDNDFYTYEKTFEIKGRRRELLCGHDLEIIGHIY